MKKAVSIILACAVISMSAPAAFAKEYPVYDSLTFTSGAVEANAEKDGLYTSGDRMVKVKDGIVSPYTGFTKTKKGTYCYKDGIKWKGWYKKGGRWYYFDPDNDGLKAVKTAKTSLGTYYLDENESCLNRQNVPKISAIHFISAAVNLSNITSPQKTESFAEMLILTALTPKRI